MHCSQLQPVFMPSPLLMLISPQFACQTVAAFSCSNTFSRYICTPHIPGKCFAYIARLARAGHRYLTHTADPTAKNKGKKKKSQRRADAAAKTAAAEAAKASGTVVRGSMAVKGSSMPSQGHANAPAVGIDGADPGELLQQHEAVRYRRGWSSSRLL